MRRDIVDKVEECLSTRFDVRTGRKVPNVSRLTFKSDGVVYDGTVLYSDVVGSTKLGSQVGYDVTAKIIQAFMIGTSALITELDGRVTAFDGDRAMAVFDGDDQEQTAVSCAFQITYFVSEILNPLISKHLSERPLPEPLRCCSGVDAGEMFVVKVGHRGNNDLLWSGRPANFAAKLSAHRKPFFSTVITHRVFSQLGTDLTRVHEKAIWKKFNCDGIGMHVYGTDTGMQFKGE